jgi:hypothetical protein
VRRRLAQLLPALSTGLGRHRFELVAVGMAVAALGFLRLNRLHYGWNTIEYTFPPLVRALPRLLLAGVALQLLVHLVQGVLDRLRARLPARRTAAGAGERGAPPGGPRATAWWAPAAGYLRALARPAWLLLWLRAWVAAMLFVYAYCWLKISVPLVRADLYDQALWKLDRLLHLGLSPNVFAIELVAGTPLARLLDSWYALWVPTMPIATAYFFAAARADRLKNFALAFVLLWTVGAWGYLALPALGPCYASPDVLDPIRHEIPSALAVQRALWANYLQMVRGRSGLLESFQPEFGVAAMPSLHVGAHALVFFWARRRERWLALPAGLATGLTFFGSLTTGWHYAVDGYAGIALAFGAVALADRWEAVGEEASPPGEPRGRPDSAPAPATPLAAGGERA